MGLSPVFVFFVVHILIAITMIGIGSMYHLENVQYAELCREDIDSVSSLTIAIGILIFLFMFISCIVRNLYQKEGYILMSLLMLIIQLAGSIHGIIKVTDKNGSLNSTLQTDMKDSIANFYFHNDIRYITSIIHIQAKWQCCGVNDPKDYNITQMPISCCPEPQVNKNIIYCQDPEQHYKEGCLNIVIDNLLYNTGMVAYICIVLSIIQMLGTLFIALKFVGTDQSVLQGNTDHINVMLIDNERK